MAYVEAFDALGRPLQVGDKVVVPCIITGIDSAAPNTPDIQLTTRYDTRYNNQNKQTFLTNCRQVLKDA